MYENILKIFKKYIKYNSVLKDFFLTISYIRITNNTTANDGIDEIKTGQR